MIWIALTVAATALQVARNATQRGLMGEAGPWGATLVRFLFGLPFSLIFLGAALTLVPGAEPRLGWTFWIAAASGAAFQVGATAAMLESMRRSSFALGVTFQQSGLPFAAVLGAAAFGDHLSLAAWAGVGVATIALAALSWPQRLEGRLDLSAAGLGLLSGAAFAGSANGFRQAALALDPEHLIHAALMTLVVVQALQSLALGGWMAVRRPAALAATLAAWRRSGQAGFFGAAASALWFSALSMSPVAPVRAVGVIEMPLSAWAGRRLFAERLSLRQWLLGGLCAAGVVMAALG